MNTCDRLYPVRESDPDVLVNLSILPDESLLEAPHGFVIASYTLTPTYSSAFNYDHDDEDYDIMALWDEDDSVRLVLANDQVIHTPSSSLEVKPIATLYEMGRVPYESFEYLTRPIVRLTQNGQSSRRILEGKVKIPATSYGGSMRLLYIRSGYSSDGLTRTYKTLAESETFSLRFRVHAHHPDKIDRRNEGHLSRRSARSISAAASSITCDQGFIEQLQNIGFYSIRIIPHLSPSACISRISAWLTSGGTTNTNDRDQQRLLIIEMDILDCSMRGTITAHGSANVTHCDTKYLQILLPSGMAVAGVHRAYGEVAQKGRLLCLRLPIDKSSGTSPRLKAPSSPASTRVIKAEDLPQLGLECKFCSAVLVEPGQLQHVHPFPSGRFDNVRIFIFIHLTQMLLLL